LRTISACSSAACAACTQHCKEKHLHRYLAEFDFRYNTRAALGFNDADRCLLAVRGAEGKRSRIIQLTKVDLRFQAARFLRWRRKRREIFAERAVSVRFGISSMTFGDPMTHHEGLQTCGLDRPCSRGKPFDSASDRSHSLRRSMNFG